MRLKHSRGRVLPAAWSGTGSTRGRRRPYSSQWFTQVAAMSKPLAYDASHPQRFAAALQCVGVPAAVATAAPGGTAPRLIGANRAFAEATGWDSAAIVGRGLEGIAADLCPLYDRRGRRRSWLVIHHEGAAANDSARQAAAGPGNAPPGNAGDAASDDFRTLVEDIGNGVLVHRDFKPLYANAACARRVGFTDGAALMREPTLLRFLPVEVHNRALRRHARLLAGEVPGPAHVLRCLTRDGEPFWVEATEKRIHWQGQPAVLVSLNDVTEQVNTRRSELMLREAIDNLSDSFILYDADQRVVLTNRRFHETLPFQPGPEAIIGKPMRELIETSVRHNAITDPRVWQNPKRFVDDFIEDRMRGRTAVREDAWPDGRWDIVKEQHTRSGGFVSVRTDITERKRAEIALRDQESRLEQALAERTAQLKGVLANIAQGVIVTAPDMTVLLVNQGYLDIFDLPEKLGRPGIHLSEYIRHGLTHGEYAAAEVAAAGGEEDFVRHRLAVLSKPKRGVVQRKLADGRVFELRQQRLPDGCIVSTYNNITDRVRTERELQRQREKSYQNEKLSALGALLAGVSHELNNPLSVVIGQAALLESMAGDSEIAERAIKVRTAADRCAKIVRTFLSMARQRPADRRAIQVNDLIEDVLGLVEHQLNTTDIVVTCNLAPDLPPVAGDSDQLSHVLLNLFINAQQAMLDTPRPRHLTIGTAYLEASRQVRITVRDNGPGVPSEIRSRIFDPFFTTKPIGQGTGVGLSVCHGMVSAHGGSISVGDAPEDELGGGAVFTVLLPAGTAEAKAETESAPRLRAVASHEVLVIDDEPDITAFLVEVLEAAGHAVDVAASGEAALERLQDRDYSAIICDLRMPHLDGPGLYERLKTVKPHLVERMIFATGDLLNAETARFLAASGRPCVEKPFLPQQIRELVEDLAENPKV